MSKKSYLFTSESVSEGHPDKVCDRISDMVVDTYLSKEPFSRVACETLPTTNKVVLAGEIRGPEIKKDILIEKVRNCIYNASLAPNSSNLQTWEFYHVTDKNVLKAIAKACFNQNAARTANQLVVFVVRKDLWRKRAKANVDFLNSVFDKMDGKSKERKRKMALKYYNVAVPTMYTTFFGIFGYLRYIFFNIVGLFRPIFREVRRSDIRIVSKKVNLIYH